MAALISTLEIDISLDVVQKAFADFRKDIGERMLALPRFMEHDGSRWVKFEDIAELAAKIKRGE